MATHRAQHVDCAVAQDDGEDPGHGGVDVVLALAVKDDKLIAEEEHGKLRGLLARQPRSKERTRTSGTYDDREVEEGGRVLVAQRLETLNAGRRLGDLEEDEADDDTDAALRRRQLKCNTH